MYTIIKSSTITNFLASLKTDLLSYSIIAPLSTILNRLLEKPVDYTRMIQHNPSTLFAPISWLSSYRFQYMEELQKVSFPNCSNIDNGVFKYCNNLTYADIGQCSRVAGGCFRGCSKLEIVIASNCTWIEDAAFADCTNLSNIQLGSVSILWEDAFENCTNLSSFDFTYVTSFARTAFTGCTKLSSIYNYNFSVMKGFSYTGLQEIPEAVTCIEYDGLAHTNISSIDNSRILEIQSRGLTWCSLLSYVSCDNCSSIGYQAFYACDNLQKVCFNKCSVIWGEAFDTCYSLSQAIFPECSIIYDAAFLACSSLTEVSFPKCQSVGMMAFQGCNLQNLNLPLCITFGVNAIESVSSLLMLSLPRVMFYVSSYNDQYIKAIDTYTPFMVWKGLSNSNAQKICCKQFYFNVIKSNPSEITSFMPISYLASSASNIPVKSIYQYDYHITCYNTNYFSDGTKIYVPSEKYSQALSVVNYSWCKSIISSFTPDPNYIYPYQYESISVPDNILTDKIGVIENGFNGCNFLSNLIIPSGVCIDDYAFRSANINSVVCEDNCILATAAFAKANIKNLTINQAIVESGTSPGQCINNCHKLEHLVINYPYSNLTGIYSCVNLKTAYIASINMNSNSTVFTTAYNLNTLSIGNNYTKIGSTTCQTLYGVEDFYTPGTLSIQSYTKSTILMPNLRSWYVDSQKVSEYKALLSCYCNSNCIVPAVVPISYHTISVSVGSCNYYDTSALACISMNCDLQDLVYSTISYSQDYIKYVRFGSFSMNTTSLPRSITVDLSYLGYSSTFTIIQNPPESSNNYIVDWNWMIENSYNFIQLGTLAHYSSIYTTTYITPTAVGSIPVTSVCFYRIYANEFIGNQLYGFWFSQCSFSKITCENCNLIGALYDVKGLKEIHFPNALSIGANAFSSMSSITVLDIPNVEYIGNSAFAQCRNLPPLSFSKVKSIGMDAFYNCIMDTVELPECLEIGYSAFDAAYSLKYLNLPKCTKIGSFAFAYCGKLSSIYLGASQVVSISNNIFYSAYSSFSVFVPSSLYSDYLVDSAWSSYSTHIYSY